MKAPLPRIVRFLVTSLNLAFLLATVIPAFAQPVINSQPADYCTTDAILNANVTPGSPETFAWFEWGPTADVQLRTAMIQLPSGATPIRISAVLTNLVPYQYYFSRAVASNGLGKVVGANVNFRAVPRFVYAAAPKIYSVACSADGSRVFGSDGVLYLSTDFGVTWKNVGPSITDAGRVISSADGRRLFAHALLPSDRPIHASEDFGATWKQVGLRGMWDLACSSDGLTVLGTTSNLLFVSRNAGVDWEPTPAPSGHWRGLTMSGDGSKMAVGNWNGFWRDQGSVWTSVNFGASWKQASAGQPARLTASGNGSKLFAVMGELGDGVMSSDWGATWSPTVVFRAVAGSVAGSVDGSRWFVRASSAFNTIGCSGDGGATWGYIDEMNIGAISMASSADGSSVYAVTSLGDLFTSQESSQHLTISVDSNAIALTWPSHRLSMRLQESSNLNSNEWAEPATQPILTNRIFRYAPPSVGDKAFYRLRSQ
jgi:hypothetical protein